MVNLKILSIFLAVLLVLGGGSFVSAVKDAPEMNIAVNDPDQFSLASQIALMILWDYNQENSISIIPTDIKSLNELASFLNTKMSNGNDKQNGLTATPIATTRQYLQNGDIVHLKNNPSVFMIYRGLDGDNDRVILENYSGLYSYSSNDFDKVFTGYAITFQKDYQGYNLDSIGVTITDKQINDHTIQPVLTPLVITDVPPGRVSDVVPLTYDSKIKENVAFYIPNFAKIDDLFGCYEVVNWMNNNNIANDYHLKLENPDMAPTNNKKIIEIYTATHKMYYSIENNTEPDNINLNRKVQVFAAWNKFTVANRCGGTLEAVAVSYYKLILGVPGFPLGIQSDKRTSMRYNLANNDQLNYNPSAEADHATICVYRKWPQLGWSAAKLNVDLGKWHVAYVKKDSNVYFQLA